ncbi:MAG: amidohydrolase family protein, partial [Pseudomonadota bacterium]
FWWYRADDTLADAVVQLHDETLSDWCGKYPDRFAALCSVAIQHPELAAMQLERAVNEFGMRGASVGGSVLGEPLSAARFDPFWAKAEALNVPVFMHPSNAAFLVQDDAVGGNGDLGNIVGNPLETTLFLSRLIFDGTLDRFPKLKIVAPHAGGYLPSYLGRTEVACDVRPNANCQNQRRPTAYLNDQVLVDSMVFSAEGLRHLVAEVGAEQVVYGSDMPFNWPDTIPLVADADFLSDAEKRAILGGNLERLLGI